MANITSEQFEKELQEQKEQSVINKWRDLKEGKIYIINSVEYVDTKYGEACILNLSDNTKVYAPSALTNRLKQDKKKSFPRYVRPTGRTESMKNRGHSYYSFDLV